MTRTLILRIALYLRISKDRTGEGLGVARQEADCRRLALRVAEQAGAEPHITVYTDNDISASSYSRKRRPEFEAMCTAIRAGRLDLVISWHDARLIRQPRELEDFIDLITAAKVDVQFVMAGRWDLSTASGRMQARIGGVVAAHESELKSERLKAEAAQHAAAGRYRGGPRPYGYEADGVTVRVDEAAEIARMYQQIVAGVSLRHIVADLNARGVTSPTGRGRWTAITVRRILLRPRNIGRSVHLGQIVGKAEWPAVVSEETWHAAQVVLMDPSRRPTAGNTPKWLGSGLYRCGVCEAPEMRADRSTRTGVFNYRCRSRLLPDVRHVSRQAERVDDLVERAVVARLEEPGAWAELLVTPPTDGVAAELRREQGALRQRLDGLAEAYGAGDIDARQLAAGSARAKARVAEIDALLASLGMRSPLDGLSPDSIRVAWFGTLPDRSDAELGLGRRRAIADSLLTVTVLPTSRGRRAAGTYFESPDIALDWKK